MSIEDEHDRVFDAQLHVATCLSQYSSLTDMIVDHVVRDLVLVFHY